MMNPLELMKIQPLLEQFQERHPKFIQFFGYAGQNLEEDALVEISVTSADGKKAITNIRIMQEDLELIEKMKGIMP